MRARVDELVSAYATKAGVTIDRIVQELAKIAFSDNPQGAGLGHDSPDEDGKARNGAERKLAGMRGRPLARHILDARAEVNVSFTVS